MIVKAFSTGISGGAAPINYLLNLESRPVVAELLSGDPERIEALIDASNRKWKYTSGSLRFAKNDWPDEATQAQIMRDFEDFAFAGKKPETWDIMWVRHTDKGDLELHFLVPRVDLETGQDLNIMQRGWTNEFRAWQRHTCAELGLTDPHALRKATRNYKLREDMDRSEIRQIVEAACATELAKGRFKSRDDLITFLTDKFGTLKRNGRDYLSLQIGEHKKSFRFKGALFEKGFDFVTGTARTPAPFDFTLPSPIPSANPFTAQKEAAKAYRSERFAYIRSKSKRLNTPSDSNELAAVYEGLLRPITTPKRILDAQPNRNRADEIARRQQQSRIAASNCHRRTRSRTEGHLSAARRFAERIRVLVEYLAGLTDRLAQYSRALETRRQKKRTPPPPSMGM